MRDNVKVIFQIVKNKSGRSEWVFSIMDQLTDRSQSCYWYFSMTNFNYIPTTFLSKIQHNIAKTQGYDLLFLLWKCIIGFHVCKIGCAQARKQQLCGCSTHNIKENQEAIVYRLIRHESSSHRWKKYKYSSIK